MTVHTAEMDIAYCHFVNYYKVAVNFCQSHGHQQFRSMVAYMVKVNTISCTCGSLMTSLVLRPASF